MWSREYANLYIGGECHPPDSEERLEVMSSHTTELPSEVVASTGAVTALA